MNVLVMILNFKLIVKMNLGRTIKKVTMFSLAYHFNS